MITKETNHQLLSFKIDVPGYFLWFDAVSLTWQWRSHSSECWTWGEPGKNHIAVMHIKLSKVTQPPFLKKINCALGYENEIQHSLSMFSFHNTNYLWSYLSELNPSWALGRLPCVSLLPVLESCCTCWQFAWSWVPPAKRDRRMKPCGKQKQGNERQYLLKAVMFLHEWFMGYASHQLLSGEPRTA